MHHKKSGRIAKYKPILALCLLSPFIAEVLFGSTPLTMFGNLPLMILFYGSGALLVRELSKRYNLGWRGVLLLAFAFGLTEEAIALQTVFNPDYFGTDISYGRAWGINWGWSLFIIGYHSLWSIALPIALTDLLFPAKRQLAWLGKVGLISTAIVFGLMTTFFYFIFQAESGYNTPAYYLAGALGLVALITAAAFLAPKQKTALAQSTLPSPIKIGVVSLLLSATWLLLFSSLFEGERYLPAIVIIGLGLVVAGITAKLFGRWLASGNWTDRHTHAIASATLVVSGLFGFNVLLADPELVNLLAHAVFVALAVGLLLMLRTKATSDQLH